MIAIPNMEKPKRCELCPCSYYSEGALSDICQITNEPIDGTPTDCPLIDIVHCKDCIWSYIDKQYGGTMWCKVHFHHYRVNSDGFCSYGERRMIWDILAMLIEILNGLRKCEKKQMSESEILNK